MFPSRERGAVARATLFGGVAATLLTLGCLSATNPGGGGGPVTTTSTTVGGGAGSPFTLTDPLCTAAQIAATGTNADGVSASCTMTYLDTSLDVNPKTSVPFADPRPGLLGGDPTSVTDAGATGTFPDVSTMTSGCSGTTTIVQTAVNTCWKNSYSSAENGQSFYFQNCTISNSDVSPPLIPRGQGLSAMTIYITNCHIVDSSDSGNGFIGVGGTIHFTHDFVDCEATAGGLNHPYDQGEGNGYGSVFYSIFRGCTDNMTVWAGGADEEWNYTKNDRAPTSSTACTSGCHSDANEEYGGANFVIAHNYYQGIWDSSTGLNVAPGFSATVTGVQFFDNKVLAQTSGGLSGNNDNGLLVDGSQTTGSDSFAVQIFNNYVYPSTNGNQVGFSHSHSGSSKPNTVCNSWTTSTPTGTNACITRVTGNQRVNVTTGALTSWP